MRVIVLAALVLMAFAIACGDPERTTPTPTAVPLPTYTPYPTYTPLPTHTPLPTYTPVPTPKPIIVHPTFTPTAVVAPLRATLSQSHRLPSPPQTPIRTSTPTPTATATPAPTPIEWSMTDLFKYLVYLNKQTGNRMYSYRVQE